MLFTKCSESTAYGKLTKAQKPFFLKGAPSEPAFLLPFPFPSPHSLCGWVWDDSVSLRQAVPRGSDLSLRHAVSQQLGGPGARTSLLAGLPLGH